MTSPLQRSRTPDPPTIRLAGISHGFSRSGRDERLVLQDVNLDVGAGQVLALVGASGSGKSTLINIAAGLTVPQQGAVEYIPGREHDRAAYPSLGMMFQESALLPWRTAEKNVALPVELQPHETPVDSRPLDAIRFVRLDGFRNYYPHELSGGMQSRVALARALVTSPELLLLDEPFANLDETLSRELLADLSALLHDRPSTVILATHNIDHAVFLANQIVVLGGNPGRVLDRIEVPLATPRKLDLFDADQFFQLTKSVRAMLRRPG